MVKIANFLYDKPRIRLLLTLISNACIGVLSSIFAAQIMPGGNLQWSLAPKVISFWILVVFVVIWIFLQVSILRVEENILKFGDSGYCLAHMRRTALEGMAKMVHENPESVMAIDAKKYLAKLGVNL